MIKVGIIGRSELMFSTAILLQKQGFQVPFIITSKEAPEYSVKSSDFEKLAHDLGAGFLLTNKLGDEESTNFIKEQDSCDIVVSVNYSGVIPQDIINLFKLGILNAHAGDLPKYRGNATVAWAILNGEEKVGLCIHSMIGGELDSGKIIARDYYPIDLSTKIGECYNWLNQMIPKLFLKAVELLSNNPEYFLEEQSLNPDDALRCYPRRPEDGRIDWSAPSEEVIRLINASGKPFSGAFTHYKEHKVTVHDAEVISDKEVFQAVPGQVSSAKEDNGSVIIITGTGKVKITEIEVDGVLMSPNKFIKGIRHRFIY